MNPFSKNFSRILPLLILLLIVIAAGCGNVDPTATVTPEISATSAPTSTPTPIPLGESDNPLTIGVVGLSSDPTFESSINQLLTILNTQSNVTSAIRVYSTDADVYSALEDEEIQAAWLQPLTYIRARQNGLADVALLTNHFGTYFYGTQFLANAESGFISYFDTTANKSTAELAAALEQFDGKRPCWVEPGSISGYILPTGLLEQADIQVQPAVLAQTYPSVVRSLYIKGVCDFGATFSYSGDPRTSSTVLNDLPDAVERVVVVWQTEAVIPNLNFSFASFVGEDLRQPIQTALLDYVKTEDGKRILSVVLGNYDVQDMKIVDDSVYEPLRSAVQFSGTDLSLWMGR